ncbi:hypothetical protein AN191_13065, partial [Loktanella sp. 5RATIMAR09]|uniref:hypothetical protein n=1 Tax=Loktanella sp. 5RATIMAR09 TaxID=1225655 RepID=UPI0007082207
MPIFGDPIEDLGDVNLGKNEAGEYWLFDKTNSADVPLTFVVDSVSEAVTDSNLENGTIIQAETDGSGGYILLLADGDSYLTWTVGSDGVLTGGATETVSVFEAETLFNVNLNGDVDGNGDPIIGDPIVDTGTDGTGTESIGVGSASNAYYVIDGAANILITAANGSPVIEGAG